MDREYRVAGSTGILMVLQASDPLQVLAAAVTPVVMVSATAILISGVNSRYIAISDRMRALAHEYRSPGVSEERRALVRKQMMIFTRRIELVSWAVRMLYTATGCFVSVALLISATLWRQMLTEVTLPLFLTGIGLIMVAIVCQLLELQASNRTIRIEVNEITESHKDAAQSFRRSL